MARQMFPNIIDILYENYKGYEGDPMTFEEYVERESDNDPGFYYALFPSGVEFDDNDRTPDQQMEIDEFFGHVKVRSKYEEQLKDL